MRLEAVSRAPIVRPVPSGRRRARVRAGALVIATISAALVWPAFAPSGNAWAESRVALVIGNAAYASRPLRNPRHDAELMARTLAATGFEIVSVLDGDAAAIRKAVTEFGRRLQGPDTVALFYYAGHGVQADGENYLIPLGSDIQSMNEVAVNAIALSDVVKSMARSSARMNIVVLDACRDNPFAETARTSAAGGLAPVVAPSGTIIGYATAPGQIARDGDGDDSPYTAALAINIPLPGLTLEEVFRNTRRRVLDATGGKQTPWEHSSLVGEFYFKPKTAQPEASTRRINDPQADLRLSEIDDWEKVKDTKDPAVLQAHVARYPGGLFAELAAVKISKLEAMRAQTPWSWIMTGGAQSMAENSEAAAAFEKAVKLDTQPSGAADIAEAARLYEQAANLGLPAAMFAAARMYDQGRGVAKNQAAAAQWFQKAADAGHAGAMAALGTMYEFGEGRPQDLAEALRQYRLSAEAGEAAGETSLAYLYQQGKGTARNLAEARRLYGLAAEKGHARAMFNLALMDLRGEGGKVDAVDAVRLLDAASSKGHSGAALELAYLYDEGRGVGRSSKLAAEHLLLALRSARREGRKIDILSGSWTFATRRELQRQLAGRGLYKGMIHGFMNEATRKALVAAAGD